MYSCTSLYIRHVARVGSIGEANMQQPMAPRLKYSLIKKKYIFLGQNLAAKLVVT